MVEQKRKPEEVIEAYYVGMEPFWHPVLPSEDLTDGPAAVELLGRRLVLVRLEGEPAAFDDVCRHLGAALSLGEVVGEGRRLRCAYHGWSYDITGRCVDIPARRGVAIPREARVRSYHTTEAYGLVWVCLDDEARHEPPAFPEFAAWRPWRALFGAYLFGAALAANFALQAAGINVLPAEFLSMLPYLLTILVLVVLSATGARKRLGAPSALGEPYAREER